MKRVRHLQGETVSPHPRAVCHECCFPATLVTIRKTSSERGHVEFDQFYGGRDGCCVPRSYDCRGRRHGRIRPRHCDSARRRGCAEHGGCCAEEVLGSCPGCSDLRQRHASDRILVDSRRPSDRDQRLRLYWERLSGFSGQFGDIILDGLSDHHQVVMISPTDARSARTDAGPGRGTIAPQDRVAPSFAQEDLNPIEVPRVTQGIRSASASVRPSSTVHMGLPEHAALHRWAPPAFTQEFDRERSTHATPGSRSCGRSHRGHS